MEIYIMRFVLLIAVTCGQALMASQAPVYEGTDFSYTKASYQFQKEEGPPKWVGKACIVAAVSAATYAVLSLDGLLIGGGNPFKPVAAATAAGVVTFANLSFGEEAN